MDEVVAFGQVKTEIGGHFDPNTYSFTCPFTGVYEFRLHAFAQASRSIKLRIDIPLDTQYWISAGHDQ